jgi:hypothetical protein
MSRSGTTVGIEADARIATVVARLSRLDGWFRAFGSARPLSCPTCLAVVEPGDLACTQCGAALRGRFGPRAGPRSPSAIAAVSLAAVAAAAGIGYVILAPAPKPTTGGGTASPLPAVKSPGATATGPTAPATPVLVAPTGPTTATGTTTSTGTTTPTGTATVPAVPKIAAVTPTPLPATGTNAPATSGTTAKPTTTANPTTSATPVKTAAPAVPPSTGTTTPAAATPPTGTTTPATTPAATAPSEIPLAPDAGASYNPYGLAATSLGAPAKALDSNPLTSWTLELDPRTDGATNAGLVIDLKPAEPVRSITLVTGSPGMRVEFYGAQGSLPASITASGWEHLASRASIAPQAAVKVNSRGTRFDRLLVWIAHAPPGVNAGALDIAELSLAS